MRTGNQQRERGEMSNAVEIIIKVGSLAPVEFSLNWRGHWSKRYKAGQQFKKDVYYSALETKSGLSEEVLSSLPLPYAELSLLFVVKEERIRDVDNWIARFKSGQDSLADAGIIQADDRKHLTIKEVDFEVNKDKAPMTVITIREV